MLGSKTISIAAAFLTAALINRSLGPSGRGIYAEMVTWVGLFSVIFGISMDTAIYHFANREIYGDDDRSRFVTIFSLSLIYALLATVALTVFVLFLPRQVSLKTAESVLFLDVLLIVTMLAANLTVFFQALGNIRFSALVGIVQSLVIVVIIGCGYIAGFIDIWFVVVNLIIFQAVALLMLFSASLKSGLFTGQFSKNLARGIISSGLKQHIATISTFIYMKINQLIVFRYCGASEAGIFAVSLNLAFAAMFIPTTFQTVLYPRVIHSSDDYEVTVRSLRIGFYSWGLVVLLIILFAEPILLLYGGRSFLPSVNIFRILMIAAWFLPLSSIVAPYCVKVGAFNACSASAVLLGVISIGMNILLIPKYSGLGAAFATTSTTIIGFCMAIMLLVYLNRKRMKFYKIEK